VWPGRAREADATILHVTMLKRISYEGEIQHLRDQIQQQSDPMLEKLKQLGELRASGVLTEADFEAQKARAPLSAIGG